MYKLGRIGALWHAAMPNGVIVFKSINKRRVMGFIKDNQENL